MKIGIIDIDTSHPGSWIPIERELGHEVSGVWDGGAVHSGEYVRAFAAEHRIPKVYASIPEMVDDVDCAIIHGCNWDTHMEKARPFVEAGKSVLIDKPLAGNLADLRQIEEWGTQNARLTGGSALRFCHELRDWLAIPPTERGTPHTVASGCAIDEFNYGIHAYSLVSGVMGPGIRSVRHLGQHGQRRIQINWSDGRMAFLVIGKQESWIKFYASITTERSVVQFQPEPGNLYRAILGATLPYLAKETDQPPVPLSSLIEPELAALAARQSWLKGDCEVFLGDLMPGLGYDGETFAAEYREARHGC